MIVVNKKPNITHMPYTLGKQKGIFSFVPGQNSIDPKVWNAVKDQAGDGMGAHYNAFLKPIGEETPEKEIDPAKLNAEEFIELIGGAMDLVLLAGYAKVENSRKGGPRKTVLEAIERQAAEIHEIEKKKSEGN